MDLTILIATYNRAESLRRTLGSLAACLVPDSFSWEVWVLDNSTDHTGEVAREAAGGGLPLRYIYSPERGKSRALNSALETVSSEAVAFADDDVLFDSRYLTEIRDGLRRYPQTSCFGCRVLPRWEGHVPAWLITEGPYALSDAAINRVDMGEEDCDFPPGRAAGGLNAVVRREALSEIGLFRTDIGPGTQYYYGEDPEFFSRLTVRGHRFRYLAKAVLHHVNEPHRMTKGYFINWSYKIGLSDAQWHALPEDVLFLWGAPRYLYRSAASRLLGWLLTVDGDKRLFLKRRLWHTLGEIRGWRERTGREKLQQLEIGNWKLEISKQGDEKGNEGRLEVGNWRLEIGKRENDKTGESGDRADKSERREESKELKIENCKLKNGKHEDERKPRVSVVIPAYNAGAFISETLDSVLAQTYGDFEIVVADDGSTDDTGEKVAPFLLDSRVRYAWGENGGVARARNRGMALARGEFIAFLDADDLWPKDKLEKQIAIMDAHPNIGLLCGDTAQFDEDGVWCKSWFAEKGLGRAFFGGEVLVPDGFAKLLDVTFVSMGTVFIRKEIVDKIGGFDESFRVVEDGDFYLRTARRYSIGWSPEVWVLRRCHQGNISGNSAQICAGDVRVREKLLAGIPQGTREHALVMRSLAETIFRAGYLAWMEDRLADAAREFRRSLGVRFSLRPFVYWLVARMGGRVVGSLRHARALFRLSPPAVPEARLPAARRGQ